MGFTNFPHGVSSFGSPVVGSRFSNPWSTHYFVDSDHGSDGNVGTDPSTAFATIQKAVTVSTGGDVIYIRPKQYKNATGFQRYSEDVTIAIAGAGTSAAIEPNAQKSLIGITPTIVPTDYQGVRWTFASATPITNNVPGTHIENIGFFVEAATYAINLVATTNGLTMGGFGVSIYNCSFKGDGTIYAGTGCDGLQVVHCVFQAKYDGTVGGINLVGSTGQVKRALIRDCEFLGGNANNMSAAPIKGAAPWYDCIIRDCYFNLETDTGEYISITGTGNTGLVANCYFASADISTTSLVTGDMLGAGCYDDAGIQAVPAT
jgi:hypothetical protein